MSDQLPLRPGEPVTFVTKDSCLQSYVSISSTTYIEFDCLGNRMRQMLPDEGKRWVRGFHHFDSEQVSACRVALALVEEAADRNEGVVSATRAFTSFAGGGGGGGNSSVMGGFLIATMTWKAP